MFKLSPDQWQALSAHLDQALEMTDDERATWLSSLQSENPALAYQLEILLREHRVLSEKGFLEASALELPVGAGLAGQIFQLSPDGSRIGIVKKHGNQIRLVPLSGGPTTTITVNGYSDLLEFYWAIDSRSTFVSTLAPGGAILLHVSLSGDAQPIWHRPASTHTWGFPSPDGSHLAIFDSNSESNVWVIKNF